MNFKHLHYFWAAAKSGGIMRASEQLHTTPQTLSGQIKRLEEQLDCALFRKVGRRLELTEEGHVAMGYADQIFALSAELDAALGRKRSGKVELEFRVGIADSVPKSLGYRLLEPALGLPEAVRLVCHEGEFQSLLGQIAVHRLDLVIANEPMGKQTHVRAFNHALGTTAMSFFAAPQLKRTLKGKFPHCLHGAPMLLQSASSVMRRRLDLWLAEQGLSARTIGEFDDAALMQAFGSEGRGIFMSPTVLEAETCSQYGVSVIGRSRELVEEFYAISIERRITHPCIVAITQAARTELFGPGA